MKKSYISMKYVKAMPKEKDGQDGFEIYYPDGYVSWCPKDAFLESNVEMKSSIEAEIVRNESLESLRRSRLPDSGFYSEKESLSVEKVKEYMNLINKHLKSVKLKINMAEIIYRYAKDFNPSLYDFTDVVEAHCSIDGELQNHGSVIVYDSVEVSENSNSMLRIGFAFKDEVSGLVYDRVLEKRIHIEEVSEWISNNKDVFDYLDSEEPIVWDSTETEKRDTEKLQSTLMLLSRRLQNLLLSKNGIKNLF